jgi:two-component system NtrC family sensor kinase
MKWPQLKTDLQWKMNLFILLGIVVLIVNFLIVYIESYNLNHRILKLELVEDLNISILEMRRFEKNYLLYHDIDSLEFARFYYDQVHKLLSHKLIDLGESRNAPAYVPLNQSLIKYEAILEKIGSTPIGKTPDKKMQDKIRSIGKNMVDLAEDLLSREKLRIGKAAKKALWWPLIITGALLILFIAGTTMVTKRVVKPLVKIERATRKIGRGDFSPLHHTGGMDSQVDRLVDAFNKMALELEARQEQIIHSRKIASLGTLISGTAHELNNPINNIVLTIDTLVGGRKISDERRAELLNDILRQALRASEIVKNLLDFSRAETYGFKELDLGELLGETIQIARNQIVVLGVKLREEIDENLPKIYGNHQGLQQVFLNIITNAVQSMQNGGDFTIRANLEQDNKINVLIKDTGTGISEEHLPNIFDPFFTTKEVGEGTGLGLSVSYGIIKRHGGQITVTSRVDKGTTFTITLPVREKIGNG